MTHPLFNIALHEPEIPNNTGNIGRTCIATGCALHLIKPLGFDTSEKACRRAGLDYWPRLAPAEHENFDAYLTSSQPKRLWLLTTKSAKYAGDVEFEIGDALVFGKETKGLPPELLGRYPGQGICLPMMPGERSLNLATAVCTVVYLAIDQLIRRGKLGLDEQGRLARQD